MLSYSVEVLREAVARFKTANILVIGDIIVDHFIWGTVSRISPEAPVPVVNVTRDDYMLGGAANVLHNVSSLGSRTSLCGVIGADEMGNRLLGMLDALSVPTDGVIRVRERPTIIKTRVIAQGQQVVRFDREEHGELAVEHLESVRRYLDENLKSFDAVIVSDYAKGMISQLLMEHLRDNTSGEQKIPIIVDPKPRRAERFKGATIMTPNNHEAEMMSGIIIEDEESLNKAVRKLREEFLCEAVLVTRGADGMVLSAGDGQLVSIPAKAREVYDVTGAGDTVAAVLALGVAVGLSYAAAAVLANYAASIVVGKVGTATVTDEELLEVIV